MQRSSLSCVLACVLACLTLSLPAAAAAAPMEGRTVGAITSEAKSPDVPPPGFKTAERQAAAIAMKEPEFASQARKHPDARLQVLIFDGFQWEASLMDGNRILAQGYIGYDGRRLGAWTGVAATLAMARGGYSPLFDKPWVWLTFGVLFLVPFVDLRRLRRLVHLDLLVLLSFGISYALFENVVAEAAVLAVYPPLLYLLGRMLFVGLRPRRRTGRLVPHLPVAVLAVGLIALCGARVALNLESDRVMDIGFASVVGADRIEHKQELYVDNSGHGDTYGPLNYVSYVPFELALPYNEGDYETPSAHAASIAFDLLTIIGLVLLGLKLRAGPEGRRLGLALGWAWAAYPFTLLGLIENTNDGLVSALLVFTLLAFGRPLARGAMLGLAAAAKFSPAGLLLLFARGTERDARRAWRPGLKVAAACLGVLVFSLAVYWPAGGLSELWACTLGYQMSRPPDWSLWVVFPNIGWTQTLLEVAGVALLVAIAATPGRRTLVEVSALGAAGLIALQLPLGHWFYFYLMWCVPLIFTALFAPLAGVATAADGEDESEADGAGAEVVELPAPLALAS